MKIFISWSGERSEALAKALHTKLPALLQYVNPWLSQSDIESGKRWNSEIFKELENCKLGIICITSENLNAPWILFEAGALSKSIDSSRVIPFLLDLDVKDLSGPLSHFQAIKADSDGIKKLMTDLNSIADSPLTASVLETILQGQISSLEKAITEIPKKTTTAKHNRSQGDILEELVSSVRNVEMRVRDVMDDDVTIRARKRSRFHPMMIHEMMRHVSKGPHDPIQILVFASFLRQDAPWLYELALEAYREIKSGNKEKAQKSMRRFQETLKLTQRSPFFEELGFDWKLFKMIDFEFMGMFEFMDFSDFEDANTSESNKRVARTQKRKPIIL